MSSLSVSAHSLCSFCNAIPSSCNRAADASRWKVIPPPRKNPKRHENRQQPMDGRSPDRNLAKKHTLMTQPHFSSHAMDAQPTLSGPACCEGLACCEGSACCEGLACCDTIRITPSCSSGHAPVAVLHQCYNSRHCYRRGHACSHHMRYCYSSATSTEQL